MNSVKLEKALTSVAGLVLVFILCILLNLVAGLFGFLRKDLTENKIHTLSEGTVNILGELESPVTLRYYSTDNSDVMSPGELALARRIKDKLDEFVRAAPVKTIEIADPTSGEFVNKRMKMLQVEKLNPEPNTDAEDSAEVDGISRATSRETNNEIVNGIAIKCVDKTETIPFIGYNDEDSLEYELARAISSVHLGKAKKIRIMTSLPVAGGFGGGMPMMGGSKPEWAFHQLLSQAYEIETLSPDAKEVPSDTSCLIVLHPFDITDQGQFAIDQFLLAGGSVMALVDPGFYFARALGGGQPMMPGMPPQGGPGPSSDLDKLFKAWGVSYSSDKVLADLTFASEIINPGNFSPTFLTLNQEAITKKGDILTDQLNFVNLLMPGSFDVSAPEGVTADLLVSSSPNSELISTFDADPTAEGATQRVRSKFNPSNTRLPLMVRLAGNFKTAFPEGDPSASKEEAKQDEDKKEGDKKETEDKENEKKEEGKTSESKKTEDKSLKASVKPGNVILIADVDFLYDQICVERFEIPGLGIQTLQPRNQNLALLQGAVEQLSGDPNLIKVRSKVSTRRPFTKRNEWKREVEKKYAATIEDFQKKVSEAEQKLSAIVSKNPENIEKAIITPEAQKEIKSLREERNNLRNEIRRIQKAEKADLDQKAFVFRVFNVFAMPIVVIVAGVLLAVYRRKRAVAQ